MKIVISADLHIKTPIDKLDWYAKRFKTYADSINADCVWLAGDLFDKSPNSFEVALLLYLLKKDMQFIIIEGNHDYTRKSRYLKQIIELVNYPNVVFVDTYKTFTYFNTPITFVSHNYLKYNPFPKNRGILVSHIRGELPSFGVSSEIPFSDLDMYNLIFLGDLHNTFEYEKGRIYYTASPYRVHKQKIKELTDINNDFFGYLEFDGVNVVKKELKLPNHYVLEQVGEPTPVPPNPNLIDVSLITTPDKLNEYRDMVDNISISPDIPKMLEELPFLDSVLEYIKELTGKSTDVFAQELKALGVLDEYQ